MTTLVKISILLVLFGILFLPVYPALLHSWISNSNNSHGLLVPLITLYLIWKKREDLLQSDISRSWWGGLLLVLCLVVYLLSYAAGITLTMRLSLIGTLLGLVLFVLGSGVFRLILFPLLFLLFMIPLPDSLVGSVAHPMQMFATTVSAYFIQLMAIPVYQEGNMLYFIQTQLEVAEACSGLRSLLSLTMLSVLFAHVLDSSWDRKLFLILSAVPIAIIANILRVSGTGVLAHFFGSQVARGFLHTFSGIAVFMFGFAVLALEYYLLISKTKSHSEPLAGEWWI